MSATRKPTGTAPVPPVEAERCRITDCPHPPLQGGVCLRHFMEGRHG